jgi:flagellar biosynthesis protein FlhB
VSERTEQATPRRLDEARAKGQVARSTEINQTAVLVATIAALAITGPRMLDRLEEVVRVGLLQAGDTRLATAQGIGTVAGWAMKETALAVAPVVLAAAVAGVVANVAQVRFRITPKALQPSFAKLNPLKGVKRLFGKDGAVEAVKAVVKTAIVAVAAYFAVRPKLPELAALVGLPPREMLGKLGHDILGISVRVIAVLVLVAAADFAWQRRRFGQQLKMTKDEVKQEHRQTDVSPEIKRAIRRRQVEMARKRMLAEVPTADVVVVNPTHFAVALRYDGRRPAPEVVAKGVDHVALAIRRVAEEAGVTVVHDAPLARTLYREVDLGGMIPEQLFGAVAEVLAFVYRTAGRRRATERRRRALSAAA